MEMDLTEGPLPLFQKWYEEMERAEIFQPTAMTLTTVSKESQPSARVVLLKEFGEQGFLFFTNYESRKGREIESNPHVALLFYWRELGRQVRIQGKVEKTDTKKSYEYFATRPRGSQIAAWASAQSRSVGSREEMDRIYIETEKRFEGVDPVPLPPFWGGYRVVPTSVEFWQERMSRYHDRLLFSQNQEGGWDIQRLNP